MKDFYSIERIVNLVDNIVKIEDRSVIEIGKIQKKIFYLRKYNYLSMLKEMYIKLRITLIERKKYIYHI